MRALIIGATGLLGRVLLEQWTGDDVAGTSSQDADVRDPVAMRRLFKQHRPQWTILAAAYTDVDGCERDPERAMAVNSEGALNVARAARESNSRLMFLSTDYVFDGEKTAPYDIHDAIHPLNAYGRSKAQAEKAIRELLPDCCVVRTSWLFGAKGRCFPTTILDLVKTRSQLSVVSDQLGCPTFNRDLGAAIISLVRADAGGIVHVTNRGACSWYEFACEILKAAGRSDVNVMPARTEDVPRPAMRPKYSVLSSASLNQFGFTMRPWTETFVDYLAEREKLNRATALDAVSAGGGRDQGRT